MGGGSQPNNITADQAAAAEPAGRLPSLGTTNCQFNAMPGLCGGRAVARNTEETTPSGKVP